MEIPISRTEQDNETLRTGDIARIWVTVPIDRAFDYVVGDQAVRIGAVVKVPFGARSLRGVVWGRGDTDPENTRLKTIDEVVGLPPIDAKLRKFIEQMARYTITPIGQILPMIIRTPGAALARPQFLAAVPNYTGELSPKREALYQALGAAPRDPKTLDFSRAVILGLVDVGAAHWVDAPPAARPGFTPNIARLSDAQQAAYMAITTTSAPSVLKGVTGSGKTEIYLEAIANAIEDGGQALVLLPEISLTSAFLDRFAERFETRPAHWHSAMSTKDRRQIWNDVATGSAPIVIGARSALFLPFADLRLIVVDEEHDRGYKQDEGVIYHGRDMAVLRGAGLGAKVILASATPSIETMVNVHQGKYVLATIDERFGHAALPATRIVDLNKAALDTNHWLANELVEEMRARLAAGEQSLLFLNRRGFAPLTLCRACGHQLGCPNCDARLVEHRGRERLQCHLCGYQSRLSETCPECDAEGKLVALGPGVERIADEAREYFPDARIAVLSSDIVENGIDIVSQIEAIERGNVDIIIGTQLVAKGHNFPKLTLVGIVDADIGLEGGDLRAAEGSFQILRQVTGRAGRNSKNGLALVQSYQPDHPILSAIIAEDDQRFYAEEIARREFATAPPFSRYIGVIISAPEFDEALQTGRKMAANADTLRQAGAQIFGPVVAPISRIRGRARIRLLIKAPRQLAIHDLIKGWRQSVKTSARVRIALDVDPHSFL